MRRPCRVGVGGCAGKEARGNCQEVKDQEEEMCRVQWVRMVPGGSFRNTPDSEKRALLQLPPTRVLRSLQNISLVLLNAPNVVISCLVRGNPRRLGDDWNFTLEILLWHLPLEVWAETWESAQIPTQSSRGVDAYQLSEKPKHVLRVKGTQTQDSTEPIGPEARHSEMLKDFPGTHDKGQTRSRSNAHSGTCDLTKPFV
ncbi:hypothetical protein CB1_000711011 [Camelus ferus]|nr:hypothetical protein CB1_000711011 [Camelus ferus]